MNKTFKTGNVANRESYCSGANKTFDGGFQITNTKNLLLNSELNEEANASEMNEQKLSNVPELSQ